MRLQLTEQLGMLDRLFVFQDREVKAAARKLVAGSMCASKRLLSTTERLEAEAARLRASLAADRDAVLAESEKEAAAMRAQHDAALQSQVKCMDVLRRELVESERVTSALEVALKHERAARKAEGEVATARVAEAVARESQLGQQLAMQQIASQRELQAAEDHWTLANERAASAEAERKSASNAHKQSLRALSEERASSEAAMREEAAAVDQARLVACARAEEAIEALRLTSRHAERERAELTAQLDQQQRLTDQTQALLLARAAQARRLQAMALGVKRPAPAAAGSVALGAASAGKLQQSEAARAAWGSGNSVFGDFSVEGAMPTPSPGALGDRARSRGHLYWELTRSRSAAARLATGA